MRESNAAARPAEGALAVPSYRPANQPASLIFWNIYEVCARGGISTGGGKKVGVQVIVLPTRTNDFCIIRIRVRPWRRRNGLNIWSVEFDVGVNGLHPVVAFMYGSLEFSKQQNVLKYELNPIHRQTRRRSTGFFSTSKSQAFKVQNDITLVVFEETFTCLV